MFLKGWIIKCAESALHEFTKLDTDEANNKKLQKKETSGLFFKFSQLWK